MWRELALAVSGGGVKAFRGGERSGGGRMQVAGRDEHGRQCPKSETLNDAPMPKERVSGSFLSRQRASGDGRGAGALISMACPMRAPQTLNSRPLLAVGRSTVSV